MISITVGPTVETAVTTKREFAGLIVESGKPVILIFNDKKMNGDILIGEVQKTLLIDPLMFAQESFFQGLQAYIETKVLAEPV